MKGTFLRRLLLLALLFLGVSLFALNLALSGVAEDVRLRVLLVATASAAVALLIGYTISRRLGGRVASLKSLAEEMLEAPAHRAPIGPPQGDLESLEQSLRSVGAELRGLVDRLRFESARREAILSGMAEGVLAVDRELRVTFSNGAFRRAVGPGIQVSEGRSLMELVRDTLLRDLVSSVLVTGEERKMRFQWPGGPRVFEVHATPLDTPSGRGALVIFHDTTDLERLEQVRKDFVANVSHELRTPLAGVIGSADTLLEGALEDARNNRRFVEMIRANAVRLSSITQDLLTLSELESEREPAEAELVPVQAVIDGTLLVLDSEARLRDVSLHGCNAAGMLVYGRRLRIEQVLLNLVSNAIKFNRPGGEVRVEAVMEPSGMVAISVTDTGTGIPSQDLPRIFERFYRVDKARSRQVGGTGLGLSIVKHAVERMDGTIQAESQIGKGSRFTVRLPGAEQLAAEAA